MFNSSTPPARRIRTGVVVGNRKKTPLPLSSELPYISPISNHSYGSKATNVPKPPRLSDTRVRLADAMQAKKNEIDARIRAEQEELERLSAGRNGSMPPPSPTQFQGTTRTSREQTIASARDTSALSAMESNPTFNSEFVIDPVVTGEVRQSIAGPEFAEDAESANEQGISELHQTDGFEPSAPAVRLQESAANDIGVVSQDELDHTTTSTTRITFISPRRSTRIGCGPGSNSMYGGGGKDIGNTTSLHKGGAGKEKVNTGNPPIQSSSRNKENEGKNSESLASGRGSGGRPPRKGGVTAVAPVTNRRKSRRQHEHDNDLEFHDRPPNIFDKFFQWYYTSSRWIVPGIFFVMVWLFAILLAVQQFLSVSDESNPGNEPGRDYTYSPPSLEPSDIPDLVSRLLAVEKRLGFVDSRLQRQFRDGISDLRSALSVASSQSATKSSNYAKNAKETDAVLSSIKDTLEVLQKSTEQSAHDITEMKRNGNQAIKLGPEQIREHVTRAVQDALPSILAATLRSDGTVEIPEPFKIALHELFVNFFPQKFDQELRKLNPDTIKSFPSWQSFIKDNEARLRTTIEDKVDDAVKTLAGNEKDTRSGAVLTLETVMLIVREKLEEYSNQWEHATSHQLFDKRMSAFSTSFEQDQNQRLSSFQSSIDHQCSSILQSATAAASSVASHVARRVSASGGTTGQKRLGPRTASGIQIPDYANKIAGGTVWPYLTSPSYEYSPDETAPSMLWGRLFPAWTGRYAPHPVTALMPTTDVGECWSFPGSYGTLAIRLSEKIYPSHVTIEHVSKLLSPDYTSAPKIVEFWVQIKNLTEHAIVESHAIRFAEKSGKKYSMSRNMQPAPILSTASTRVLDKNGREFVKLHTFEFDIEGDDAQSFALPVDMINIGVAVNIVAFVIRENHGNKHFTCLYRAKVHGFTPGALGESARSGKRDQSVNPVKGWW
ncbi:hypothetical protein K440DRAFT_642152 [Wilcoxina mikolae CBS 423.85]|nr:hypothetical protein K440DRAFT_642152 [Wilcoxina mikolae CBS 423.85]